MYILDELERVATHALFTVGIYVGEAYPQLSRTFVSAPDPSANLCADVVGVIVLGLAAVL